MSGYEWEKDEEKYFKNVNDYDTIIPFENFNEDTSFKIEFDFMYGHASGPHVDLLESYDSGWIYNSVN